MSDEIERGVVAAAPLSTIRGVEMLAYDNVHGNPISIAIMIIILAPFAVWVFCAVTDRLTTRSPGRRQRAEFRDLPERDMSGEALTRMEMIRRAQG